MIESAVDFNIASDRRYERFAWWGEPIDYCRLQTLRIIGPGARSTLLQLLIINYEVYVFLQESNRKLTKLDIRVSSSTELLLISLSSSPGTLFNNFKYTLCSLLSLEKIGPD